MSVASDAGYADHIASVVRSVFDIPSLRPKQHKAVDTILFHAESEGKLLVADRTGGRKSLVLQLTAVAVTCFSPDP